ncbi:peptidase [Sphingomonas sp.]|uniref:peptidase n=1 Tax=Sphingomonas sp. TaxID=28214 RepID=UPI003AFFDDFF
MTYGLGMLVDDGLVMIADTRTNAGVDDISTYRKLHLVASGPDRLLVVASAGNLSMTQRILATLAEGLPPAEEGAPPRRLSDVPSMFRAAHLVGEAMAIASDRVAAGLAAQGIATGVSLLLGGRVGHERLRLYLFYEAGNFIECQRDKPFLQIGDIKYGKPILDRSLRHDMPVNEAVKIGLISFDSTMRSNLSVGRPLDLMVIPADAEAPVVSRRIEVRDIYFDDLSMRWSMLLDEVRATIPQPPFLAPD